MNYFITSLLMWSLIGQFEGGVAMPMKKAEGSFEPRIFQAICMPDITEHEIMNLCGQRVILCSAQDARTVDFIPEVVEWRAIVKNFVEKLSHSKPGSRGVPVHRDDAIKIYNKYSNVRAVLLRMGVAVISDFYQHTHKDLERWDALCKAIKDQRKAIVMQQQKNIVMGQQHARLHKQRVKNNFKKGSII